MTIQILMPELSSENEEGLLAKWCVKEGDAINVGDVIAEVEMDKATLEIEAVDKGILGKIIIAEGTEGVKVGETIALLLEDGEDEIALSDWIITSPTAESIPDEKQAPKAETKAVAAQVTKSEVRIFSSPLARRIAVQEGIDMKNISGSGPRGRIVKRDIDAAIADGVANTDATAPAQQPQLPEAKSNTTTIDDSLLRLLPGYEILPNSNMRKTIAKRLTDSARDVPHFNLQVDVEIDKLLDLRKELNSRDGADYKLSINDFIIKATSLALTRVPESNVAYVDDAILKFKQVDMAIAVAVKGGLITPIIKDAASKGLATLAREAKKLATRARDGKLSPEEYRGGTFTISNLGMFGIKSFNSILNPPHGGILSVGAAEQRAIVKDGALSIATVVSLVLAVDHRCIDGATGAAMMRELNALIEEPIALML